MSDNEWVYFPGYPKDANGLSVVTTNTPSGRTVINTPNVLKAVKDHFACPDVLGAEIEDDGGPGSAGSHWEERLFQVRIFTFFRFLCTHAWTRQCKPALEDVSKYKPTLCQCATLFAGRDA